MFYFSLFQDRESACFSTLLLQYTLGELELFLKKLKLVEEEGAEILLPSVVWSEEIRDFVPTKFKEMVFISRDRARLWYLKVCVVSKMSLHALYSKALAKRTRKPLQFVANANLLTQTCDG